jgi:hypothetical protein
MRTAILVLLVACSSDGPVVGEPLPTFALVDVNDTSPTAGRVVSTDSHAARTAWYFGHAT